jgi:hypothetical protein
MSVASDLPEVTDVAPPLQPFDYEVLCRLNHVNRPRTPRGDAMIFVTAAFLGGFIIGRLFR